MVNMTFSGSIPTIPLKVVALGFGIAAEDVHPPQAESHCSSELHFQPEEGIMAASMNNSTDGAIASNLSKRRHSEMAGEY